MKPSETALAAAALEEETLPSYEKFVMEVGYKSEGGFEIEGGNVKKKSIVQYFLDDCIDSLDGFLDAEEEEGWDAGDDDSDADENASVDAGNNARKRKRPDKKKSKRGAEFDSQDEGSSKKSKRKERNQTGGVDRSQPSGRKVQCISLDGLTIYATYDSHSEASRKTTINQNAITQVCLGKQTTAGQFHWRFAPEGTIIVRALSLNELKEARRLAGNEAEELAAAATEIVSTTEDEEVAASVAGAEGEIAEGRVTHKSCKQRGESREEEDGESAFKPKRVRTSRAKPKTTKEGEAGTKANEVGGGGIGSDGHQSSGEKQQKRESKTSKRVQAITSKGFVLATYASQSDVGKHAGFNHKAVGQVCLGKQGFSGGFRWRFGPADAMLNPLTKEELYEARRRAIEKGDEVEGDGPVLAKKKSPRKDSLEEDEDNGEDDFMGSENRGGGGGGSGGDSKKSPLKRKLRAAGGVVVTNQPRKVQVISTNGLYVLAVYYSQAEAHRKTNIPDSSIGRVCNGKNFRAGGYFWTHAAQDADLNQLTLEELRQADRMADEGNSAFTLFVGPPEKNEADKAQVAVYMQEEAEGASASAAKEA